ncbi:unnamed protein product [Rotaria sp. Silwood2]|nr:unnamed protein product [Rotaria sp. Silwood2]CAF4708083.1 unnamed protein product [Rotaria sp. Silwood2]
MNSYLGAISKFLFVGIHYCGISLHHINNSNQLQVFVLACRAYDLNNQTSPSIRKFVNSILEEFGLRLDSSSFIVSDNENKMKSTFNDVNCIGCSVHYMNKPMEKTFTDAKNIDLKQAQELFSQVRELVEHVRRCHKQNKLSKKLQIYSKTRFNEAFHMFNIFNEIFDEIPHTLSTNFLLTYSLINQKFLQDICNFISTFDEVIEKLSVDTRPTLHLVVPLRQHLIDHCSTFDDEDDNLVHIKKFISTY